MRPAACSAFHGFTGTDGSNPSPSSRESRANLWPADHAQVKPDRKHLERVSGRRRVHDRLGRLNIFQDSALSNFQHEAWD